MVTALKTAKVAKAPAKVAKSTTKVVKVIREEDEAPHEYRMPREVSEWISQAKSNLEQANSKVRYLNTEVERLRADNSDLRRSHKIMEARVMGASRE